MINLMYAGNDRTFDGLLVSLLSVTKHHNKPLNVYILTMDYTEVNETWKAFSEEHRKTLENVIKKVNEKSSVILIDVKEHYANALLGGKNQATDYTPYCMLRLLADKVAELPDKVLYLDYDTVVCKDIQSLWDIDITNYEFAGAKDYYGRFFINRNYLNSGVLLMNLKKIKETKLFEKCLELLKVKKLLLPDQSALHRKATSKLIIPRKFNEQHKLYEDTVVRHFSMTLKFFPIFKKQNIKPWQIDKLHNILKCHDFDDILDEYLRIKNKENKR